MIKAKTVAAWVLALAIGAVPAAGLGQGSKVVKPTITKEIKKLLPKASDDETEEQKKRDQSLPEPIMDEQTEPIGKEVPS